MNDDILKLLASHNIPFYLENFSALDKFFRIKEPGFVYILTEASLVTLATLFSELDYPGLPYTDAGLSVENKQYFFRCVDKPEEATPYPFSVQNLIYDLKKKKFIDQHAVYADLRESALNKIREPLSPWLDVIEAAKLTARYHYTAELPALSLSRKDCSPPLQSQKDLLITLLYSRHAEKGLNFLYQSGFIDAFWPEIAEMFAIKHVKDYHPEGNVWEHTLEALKYRKDRDLTLSLALFLHDLGKTASNGTKDKPFNNHAEIGASLGRRFLKHLGFGADMIDNVAFLIRYHMLPGALKKMPLYRIEKIMESPLFPTLLELFRADMSATFEGPESYYHACRIYKTFLKKKGNPYKVLDRSRQVLD